jgi:hypothetical protein
VTGGRLLALRFDQHELVLGGRLIVGQPGEPLCQFDCQEVPMAAGQDRKEQIRVQRAAQWGCSGTR